MTEVVRGHRRGPAWTRVAHGLYVSAETEPTAALRLAAWCEVLPEGAVFTHLTAAAIRGWWLPAPVPHPVLVAVSKNQRHPQRAGLCVLRLAQQPRVELVRGLPLAEPAETLLAAARDLELLDLVPLADSAVRAGDCSLDDLERVARSGRPGVRMLRRAIPLLDGRSESPWESVLRVLHRAAGIEVEPQHEIYDASGAFVARADLWLVGTRRIHEYDGEVHRGRDAHRRDLARDRRLVEGGWQRLGFTAPEVLREGPRIIASADAVLGRPWDSRRAHAWRALVSASWWGAQGRERARRRWSTTRC